MYEPLLRITVPDHRVQLLRGPDPNAAAHPRKVVLIQEAWQMRTAELNTKAIVERLLESGEVRLIGLGDFGERGLPAYRPGALETVEDLRARREQAEAEFERGLLDVPNYLCRTLHAGVELRGVNSDELLDKAREARAARMAALELLYLLGPRLGIDSRGWYEEAMRRRFESTPGMPSLHAAQLPVPILARLREHLKLVKSEHFTARMHSFDELFAGVREDLRLLPLALRAAAELGVEPERYPRLLQMSRLVKLEGLNSRRVREENRWLRRAVLQRLVGGQIDPHGGLKALFERNLRLALRSQEGDKRLLSSPRPLHASAEAEIAAFMEEAAESMERNDVSETSQTRRLLDLASIFRLNGRRYARLRKVYGVRSAGTPILDFEPELALLKKDAVRRLTGGKEDLTRLFMALRQLDDLNRLAHEEITPPEAERAVTHPLTAGALAATLRSLGARLSPEEQEQVSIFDEECARPARAFYDSCIDQAKVMASNLTSAMGGRGAALLICGGFHPEGVARELTATEQAACSIIMPAPAEKEPARYELGPDELRRQKPGRMTINYLGSGIRQVLEKVRGGEGLRDEAARLLASLRDAGAEQDADARQWVEERGRHMLVEEFSSRIEAEPSGGALQECRVCRRQARKEDAPTVCAPWYAPAVVFACPRCAAFVCAGCAGREPVGLYPGHGGADAERLAGRFGGLVCNFHATPLGSGGKRRWLGGNLPGHSWFG
jgi:hypothetical protein